MSSSTLVVKQSLAEQSQKRLQAEFDALSAINQQIADLDAEADWKGSLAHIVNRMIVEHAVEDGKIDVDAFSELLQEAEQHYKKWYKVVKAATVPYDAATQQQIAQLSKEMSELLIRLEQRRSISANTIEQQPRQPKRAFFIKELEALQPFEMESDCGRAWTAVQTYLEERKDLFTSVFDPKGKVGMFNDGVKKMSELKLNAKYLNEAIQARSVMQPKTVSQSTSTSGLRK